MTDQETWAMFAAAALQGGKTGSEAVRIAHFVVQEMHKTFPEPLAAPAPAGVTLPPGWTPRDIRRHDGLSLWRDADCKFWLSYSGEAPVARDLPTLAAALEAADKVPVRE